MKFKLLFPSLWLLAAGVFASSAAANPCPSNLSDPLAYQRHHNPDRCEGIRRQNISSSFSWVSFATSNLRRYDSTLRLILPEVGENPTLTVRSYSRRYQLDPLEFQPRGDWYEFSLQTNILQEAHVAPESLRAIASLPGSQPIYVPVVIDSPSPRYNFVFYSPNRAIVRSFEVRRNNQVIYRDSRPNPRDGEIIFSWDGRNQPTGLYQLGVEAEIHQRGMRPETVTRNFLFRHNPDWLSQ